MYKRKIYGTHTCKWKKASVQASLINISSKLRLHVPMQAKHIHKMLWFSAYLSDIYQDSVKVPVPAGYQATYHLDFLLGDVFLFLSHCTRIADFDFAKKQPWAMDFEDIQATWCPPVGFQSSGSVPPFLLSYSLLIPKKRWCSQRRSCCFAAQYCHCFQYCCYYCCWEHRFPTADNCWL